MNKKYYVGIGIAVVAILAMFIFWNGVTKIHPNKSVVSRVKQKPVLPKEVGIVLDKNGFIPSQVTITIGTAVRWKNESGARQTVNSDNYPTNQLHKELNFGVIANGSSVVYTFTKHGVYGYHNQFSSHQAGKIIVVN